MKRQVARKVEKGLLKQGEEGSKRDGNGRKEK